jgi:hypothetical protein
MTAEIAVMNRVAIALAADSASTSVLEGNVPKIPDGLPEKIWCEYRFVISPTGEIFMTTESPGEPSMEPA